MQEAYTRIIGAVGEDLRRPGLVGTPERALQLSAALRQRGFFIPAIRPPSVPAGESLLRLSLSFGHSDELLDELLRHLKELSKQSNHGS